MNTTKPSEQVNINEPIKQSDQNLNVTTHNLCVIHHFGSNGLQECLCPVILQCNTTTNKL